MDGRSTAKGAATAGRASKGAGSNDLQEAGPKHAFGDAPNHAIGDARGNASSDALSGAAQRLEAVSQSVAKSTKIARRRPEDVELIAISKTRSNAEIASVIRAGQRVFGENRVQEAEQKWPALREEFAQIDAESTASSEFETASENAPPNASDSSIVTASEQAAKIELHLVGQLQSNKAEEAVRLFDYIHSLDRPSLVTALAKAMDRADRRIPCFIQVNIGEEAQKGGCALGDLKPLIAAARDAQIPVAGLMCIPPAEIEAAPFFAFLDKLARDNGIAGRSMGMSADFESAIMLGATHIRVGTALFGPRD